MSDPFEDQEQMQRAAGLTRETLERINVWLEKQYEEMETKNVED